MNKYKEISELERLFNLATIEEKIRLMENAIGPSGMTKDGGSSIVR